MIQTAPLPQITGKNESGKQQPVSEPVLTPHGWVPIGAIKCGDFVVGSDGLPTAVTGVYPQAVRTTFLVKMEDGASTRCGPDHLWRVGKWTSTRGTKISPKGKTVRYSKMKWATIPTHELMSRGLRNGSASSRKWSVPMASAVQFSDRGETLPIDPYALGLILGDGHIEPTGYTTVTSFDKAPEEIRPHLGEFEHKGYTNPTLMFACLHRLGVRYTPRKAGRSTLAFPDKFDSWPDFGLVRIQWEGPWTKPGVPIRVRYRHTHWIGCTRVPGEEPSIFDVNAISVGGWIPLSMWRERLVPWILKNCEPKADGKWHLTHVLEVSRL